MSRFGWAFVNSDITGAVANGSDKSIQFASGSSQKISGSSNLTFDYNTNTLRLTGTLYADSLIVSSSIIYKSGSTKFGDDVGDTHQFTGSVYNKTLISGTVAQFTTVSASVISASTYVGVSATAGGTDTNIQFNSGSTFSGSQYFVYDYTNRSLQIGTSTPVTTGSLTVNGSTRLGTYGTDTHIISGNVFFANAINVAGLTNLTGNLKSSGQISASADILTNGNVTANGILSSSTGIATAGYVNAASNITSNGIVSSSGGIQTAGAINANSNIVSNGFVSSSTGLQTGGQIRGAGGLVITGSTIFSGSSMIVVGAMTVQSVSSSAMVQASSLKGDGLNITGIQGTNVNGVGNDWTVQIKNGSTGTLTGSSNLVFTGSSLNVIGTVNAITSSFNRLEGQVTGTLTLDSIVSWNFANKQFQNSSIYTTIGTSSQAIISASSGLVVSGATNLGTVYERLLLTSSIPATVNFDTSNQSMLYINNPPANFVLNFTNVGTTDSRVSTYNVVISQSGTPYSASAIQVNTTASTVKWANSTVPTGNASKHDVYGFSLIRSGSTWVTLGQLSTYG